MEKEIITQFLNIKVKLVKNDDFVIWGFIKEICEDGVLFFTDGKLVFISYHRIREISPTRRRF